MLVWFIALYALVVIVLGRHIPLLYDLYLHGIPTTGVITQRTGETGLQYAYMVRGRRYAGFARIGVAAVPISGVGDSIYLTYLPRDPSINVAGDVKDLLYDEYQSCANWLPWVAMAVILLFVWNAMMRQVWFAQVPFGGSRFDRLSRLLFGD